MIIYFDLNQTGERQSYMRKFDDLCVRFTQQTTKKTEKQKTRVVLKGVYHTSVVSGR